MYRLKLFLLTSFTNLVIISGLDNGLARTPPMGWMSWQRFRCTTNCASYPDECISDKLFRRTADLMSSEGYLEAGYEYLIIDDCWLSEKRDSEGRLQPDPSRFPYGMKSLSDYIHSKGLKFGLYENYGNYTCAGFPGIIDHLEIDAKTFAEWEVDYIKLDGCYANQDDYEEGYAEFGKYLNETGRPIVYSCSWPFYQESEGIKANYPHLAKTCNLWRNWYDIDDDYDSLTSIIKWFAAEQDRLIPYAGPGHWNDPDMLLVGNSGLSYTQSKYQMAIWAILAAPLLMSLDFNTIQPEFKHLLLNKEIIAINQDELGIQGSLVFKENGICIWARPVAPVVNGYSSFAIVFHSEGYSDLQEFNITFEQLGLKYLPGYFVRDIFENRERGTTVELNVDFIVSIKPHDVIFLKLTPIS